MASMLRWTQAQLDDYLAKRSSPSRAAESASPAPPSASTPTINEKDGRRQSASAMQGKPSGKATRKVSSAKLRAEDLAGLRGLEAHLEHPAQSNRKSPSSSSNSRTNSRRHALDSLLSAVISGSHESGKFLELRFDGAKLLSLNRLHGLTHFERIKYRKTCHKRVHDAILLVVGGPRHLKTFDHFIIRSHRTTARKADTDAKSSYLKYMIDGLRYANVIVDDREEFFRDLLCTESKGEAGFVIRIEQVPRDYVPIAERTTWARSIMSLDDDDAHPRTESGAQT